MENKLQKNDRQEVALADTPDFFSTIIDAAKDPQMDVAKMRELLVLRKEVQRELAENEFNKAFKIVQTNLPPVIKDSRNPSTNSNFARLEKIQDILQPLLLENNFTLSYSTDKSDIPEHYGVTADLTYNSPDARIGSFTKHARCDVPTDTHGMKGTQNKTKTHGMGSAMTYGQRYLVTLLFNIRLIGVDDDGNSGNRPKPAGPAPLASGKKPLTELDSLKKQLWGMTATIHQGSKDVLRQYLTDDCDLDPAKTLEDLPAAELKSLIEKVKGKLQ